MPHKDSNGKAYVVTTAEICGILGLSARRIQQLAKEGALVRSSHDKFDLPASIKSYLTHRMEKENLDDER
jgi:phage terminase Nu1 subunit (DNA packaging protein)